MNTLDRILHGRVTTAIESSMAVTEQVRQAKEDLEAPFKDAALTIGNLRAQIFKINLHNDDLYAHLVEIENMLQEAR